MRAESQRLEYFDSIRGLAALAVLLSHSVIFAWSTSVWSFIHAPFIGLVFNGKQAVVMFFVLSGYVLARPYVEVKGQPARRIFLPAFYLRRFIRIWLPWFGVFCLSALAQMWWFREWSTSVKINDWAAQFWHTPMTLENFLRQCAFIQHDAKVQLLNQDWSLGIELKASVLLPLLVVLTSGWRWVGLLVLAIGIFFGLPTGQSYVSFILGVLLAKFDGFPVMWLKLQLGKLKAAVLIAGMILYQAQQFFGSNNYSWLATSFGCVLILIAVMASQRLQMLLNLRWVVFLGQISYSVYLLQFIVILCVLPPLIHLLNYLGMERAFWLFPLTLLASVGLTILFSALSYRWLELPCIALGSNLSKKLSNRSA